MRLIFMGTPAAAVPTLKRCLDDGHEIAAVWTQPDRPAGRGNKLTTPPVKEFALAHNLTIHQPAKIKTDEARELFASHEADAAVVVAYGRILPSAFLRAPRRGCINVHFSLLPRYRGAAPVNWAIIEGQKETGVSTMLMDEGLDTGSIFLQTATPIGDTETAPQLMDRLALLGAGLLSETLTNFETIRPRQQREAEATPAPMLRRETGRIDWSSNAFEIERRVRGLQPWPGAYTEYARSRLIIWRAEALHAGDESSSGSSVEGEIVEAHADHLIVACGHETALRLVEVQPEGRKRMSVRDFLNGTRIRAGERCG
ncbi:MAG: methionyl-tRNA formyltransferase [Pyrinomonadaceae bacterium]|nr:methionyl-tRNA formyltransferase [Pyrinomonadaceae bacterium]